MNTTDLSATYGNHVIELQSRTAKVLERENFQGLVIHSGKDLRIFLDDMNYPFKTNAHFKAWLPIINTPNCWLIVNGIDKPKLAFYQPIDFWHKVEALPNSYWNDSFDIVVMTSPTQVEQHLPYDKKDWVYIGGHTEVATALGFEHINNEEILNYLHYHRAYKTDYELSCLREANRIGVLGHKAAREAFLNKGSEFDIQLAYLNAVQQGENEVPYGNIIALNENAAILHYTVLDKTPPKHFRSFLIDAGAQFNGYASDITRTYAFEDNEFSSLIHALDVVQQRLADALKPGLSYVDLHLQCHQLIANVLVEFELVKCSAEEALQTNIVKTFFPHGLGHHLGLQVHDMGGFMADERGTHISPPDAHPFLRATRKVEAKQVFTIEPGLYFIETLLNELKNSNDGSLVNWQQVELFKPFGGIRIEDNVIVHQSHNENMTRDFGLS